MLRAENHSIPKHGERRVRVYVPASYDGTRPFPLLVMFDGQNVFDDHGSYAGGWHAHRAVERLGKQRARPIVVGIDHAGPKRIEELAPWTRSGTPGRADTFIGWIADVLVPDLRKRHYVVAGPEGVLVAGSSMGGLAATYAHFKWPHAFGGALAMSPSFWLSAPRIFEFVAAQPKPWTSQIYLDGGERDARAGVERMAALLRGRGYDDGKLRWRIDRKGTHGERAWRRRFPAALRFFYR